VTRGSERAQVKSEDTIELSDKAKNFLYVHEAIERFRSRSG
jgi:hypothetical protein